MDAGRVAGTLLTRPLVLPGGRLTLNARAARGAVTVRLMDAGGTPPDGLGAAESKPVEGDVLSGEARWPASIQGLRGRPVRLEFHLRRAALFGFEFQPGPR